MRFSPGAAHAAAAEDDCRCFLRTPLVLGHVGGKHKVRPRAAEIIERAYTPPLMDVVL